MEIKDEFKKVKEMNEKKNEKRSEQIALLITKYEKAVFKLTMSLIQYGLQRLLITGDKTITVPFRMPAELMSSTKDEIHRLKEEDGVSVVVDGVHDTLTVSLDSQHPYY